MPSTRNEYHRSWYENNKEHARQKNKEWVANNREKRNECLRKYRTSLKGRFGEIRKQSRQRGKSFNLTFEQYSEVVSQPCHYCNYKLGKPVAAGSGIDRINNEIGYEPTNVISCCKTCNAIKMDYLSFDETKAVIKLILTMRGLE